MIGIIDYGMGNLLSIRNSLEMIGANAEFCNKPDDLMDKDKIILPGVGAFGQAMKNLEKSGLKNALNSRVLEKKIPILGICLGMQLMSDKSEEGGTSKGLGWIKGEVVSIHSDKKSLKIPHVGWNSINTIKRNKLFFGINDKSDFYFLHSYHLVPFYKEQVISTCDYGSKFASSVNFNNIFGVQFHPEKSQDLGLKLLNNFVNI